MLRFTLCCDLMISLHLVLVDATLFWFFVNGVRIVLRARRSLSRRGDATLARSVYSQDVTCVNTTYVERSMTLMFSPGVCLFVQAFVLLSDFRPLALCSSNGHGPLNSRS